MAKVCEMIVNRDYIRENNAGHPPRLIPRVRVRLLRARGDGLYMPSMCGCTCTCVYTCVRACVHTCVCGRDAFTHVCGKKAAWRTGGRAVDGREDESGRAGGREDVDIFLRATRECRERHAFDWPGVVGAVAGEQGAG